MKYPMRKFLAYCMVLVFLFTCLPGSVLASAGDSASSGGAVEETENPADISDGSGAANPTVISTEAGIEEALPDTAHGPSQQDVSAQATVQEYINLQRFTGTYDVVGAAANAPSTSDYPNIASFQNGKIVCGNTGIADVQVQMTNGDTAIFHVSVYWEYPQPKTAKIKAGHNNVILQKFAKKDDTAGTGDVLNAGDTVQILYSASDQTSGASGATAGVMHYVKSGNKEGWIFSQENNHRVMDPYYQDIAAGDSVWISTTLLNIPQENNTWSHTGGTRISITTGTHNTYANQCKVTAGNSAGTAMVTGTDTYHEASSFITIYTSVNHVGGRINKDTAEYSGATTTYPRGKLTNGTPVTINGESGNYWRIGENRFVRKSDVDIPATGLTVTPPRATIYTSGNPKTVQLKGEVTPQLNGVSLVKGKIRWSTSNKKIADVNAKGLVSAVSLGRATITGEIDGRLVTVPIFVSNVPVTGIQVTPKNLALQVGSKSKLKASVTPKNAYDKTVLWSSSDEKVATVDENGNVTAVAAGGCEIRASGDNGHVTGICKVAVTVAKRVEQSSTILLSQVKTGFNGNEIKWTKSFLKEVDLYGVWRVRVDVEDEGDWVNIQYVDSQKETYTFVDATASKGGIYCYTVYAYNDNADNYLDESNTIVADTQKLTLTTGPVGVNKVTLNWNRFSGSEKYEIYRADKKKGSYKKIKTLKGEKKVKYTDSKRKSEATCYYKVVAVEKGGVKTKTSNTASAKTLKKGANMAFFKKKYSFVSRDSENINKYGIPVFWYRRSNGKEEIKTIFPTVKYELEGNTLQIHLYVEFDGDKDEITKRKSDFKNGVSAYWGGVAVVGSRYDFEPGVSFVTKIVFHEKGNGKYDKEQKFAKIYLGGEDCGKPKCSDSVKGNHWFHAHAVDHVNDLGEKDGYQGYDEGWRPVGGSIYMPSDSQLLENSDDDMKTNQGYLNVAAHEMGHLMGLDDSYDLKYTVKIGGTDEKRIVPRLTESAETCAVDPMRHYYNIMQKDKRVEKVRPNDIEMILYAFNIYSKSYVTGLYALQSYKAYKRWTGEKVYFGYKKSGAIRMAQ